MSPLRAGLIRGTLRTFPGTRVLSLGTSKAETPGKSALERSWTLQKIKWKDGNTGSWEPFELPDPA